ncbi:MAG: DNA-binding protein [Promethearchaeota archaeon]|nr:MAG: DNA-binding protein [Candidatus Lokiarchaeota archaeon]
MKSIESQSTRVLVCRVNPGEDLTDAITEIVKRYNIKSGLINVIGALSKFTIGYFDLNTKEYQFKTFEENVELVNCMGNIAFKEGEPIIHLHFQVGRPDYSVLGGHLGKPSIVSVTGEVFIYEIDEQLQRKNDPRFNLSLLDF